MSWNDLTIPQKSQLMNIYRRNGVTSLLEMKRLYDSQTPSSSIVEGTLPTPKVASVYANGGPYSKGYRYYPKEEPVTEDMFNGPNPPYGFYDAPIDWEDVDARQHYAETRFQPAQESSAGARGPYQIMPDTWKQYSERLGLNDIEDYNQNKRAKDALLKDYYNDKIATKGFPSDSVRAAKALASYNWGIGNVDNFLKAEEAKGRDVYHSMDWVNDIPRKQTREYVNFTLRRKSGSNDLTNEAYEAALPHRFDVYPEAKQYRGGGDKSNKKLIDKIRSRLYNNIDPFWSYSNPLKVAYSAVVKNRPYYGENSLSSKEDSQIAALYEDYLQIPEKERQSGIKLEESNYKPSKASDDNVSYKKLRLSDEDILRIKRLGSLIPIGENKTELDVVHENAKLLNDNGWRTPSAMLGLGNYTIGHGKDDSGEYVSYYDTYDINPYAGGFNRQSTWLSKLLGLQNKNDITFGIGSPVEVYDRIYFNEGDSENLLSGLGNGEEYDPYTNLSSYAKGGKIHIKKKNRGKFTALKKRTGHSASWFKAHGTPAQKKMAVFALNARKWKHSHGGFIF